MQIVHSNSIVVNSKNVRTIVTKRGDYFCLTDLVRAYDESIDPKRTIQSWIRKPESLDFFVEWEKGENPDFRVVESTTLKTKRGDTKLSITKWIKEFNAVGFIVLQKNGGIYAHKELAEAFCIDLNPAFKLKVIRVYNSAIGELHEKSKEHEEWLSVRLDGKAITHLARAEIKKNIETREGEDPRDKYKRFHNTSNLIATGQSTSELYKKTGAKKGKVRDKLAKNHIMNISIVEAMMSVYISQGVQIEDAGREVEAKVKRVARLQA